MKRRYFALAVLAAFCLLEGSHGTQVSFWGYSIVAINATSGKVRWQFGQDMMDPQLQLDGLALKVTAVGEDKQPHTWELSKATGTIIRESPPEDLTGCCLDYMDHRACDDPSREEMNRFVKLLPWRAVSCDTIVSQSGFEPIIHGVDRRTGRALWDLELRPKVGAESIYVFVWPWSKTGFLVLESCNLHGLTDGGRIKWRTRLLKNCWEPPIVERPSMAALGRDVLIIHMNRLFRVNPRTGRIIWSFDAGPSADPYPVFDGKYLYVARRKR